MAGKSVVADPTAYLFDSTFGRYTKGGLSGAHYGLDITSANINNSAIRAAKSGVVTFKGWTGGGNTISIFDGKNTYTYMHMIRPSKLKVGSTVQAGQHVGNVGSTFGRGGRSTGPHLHVQVNKGRTPTGTFMDTFKGAHAAIDPRLGGYLKVSGGGSIDFNNLSTGSIATGSIDAAMADDLNRIQEERLAEIEAAINEHNEAEKMKQKVDELRKKLMDTQLEAIRNSQAKRENLYNIHKSHIESFDRSRELQAAKSAKYEYQLNKIEFEKGRNTAAWRKKNEELQISKELEQKWEQDKITYINKALKSNKDGIFGSQTVYRDEMEKAKREAEQNIRDIANGVMRARGEIAASLVDQIIDDYNDDVDKIQRIIDGYSKQKSHLDAMDVEQATDFVGLQLSNTKKLRNVLTQHSSTLVN
ncbi:peptidoglycan DD-metalloendopeptidase family protein [Staphylococcus agnetis]|nr:peptidoglycan DD-metalloendopeptidase family protein [Staphylococcus agnetis]